MSTILKVRLAVAAIGLVVWGYAVYANDATLRLVGMVMLALSLLLRWIRTPRADAPRDGDAA